MAVSVSAGGTVAFLPSQSRLCECFLQFGKCFLFSCLGRGNFRCRSFFLLFFREQVDVVLRQRAQLGFGFGVVEIDLGRADDRQVGVREVVTVGTEIGGRDELDGW